MEAVRKLSPVSIWRLIIGSGLLLVALTPFHAPGEVLRGLFAEAYLGVAVFVIFTMLLVNSLEKLLKFDLGELSRQHPQCQVLIAALLGVFPGCGGTIMVVGYYLRGEISFAAIVAALTATMGDTAFLLLAQKPLVGLVIIGTAFTTAIITGYLVQILHGATSSLNQVRQTEATQEAPTTEPETSPLLAKARLLWWLCAVPGVLLGLVRVSLLSSEPSPLLANLLHYFGFFAACLSLFIWVFESGCDEANPKHRAKHWLQTIEVDTSFITFWVLVSYISYQLAVYTVGLDLITVLVSSAKYFLPLVAILIGFIPGCGPQIIVATLYIQGVIPFSAQLGNAISTDGDALFPAIAMAPKAAILATFYSAIPAFLLAYGYLFLFE